MIDDMPRTLFHPAVARWFESHFGAPTEVQTQAWPAIRAGQSTLIVAPTGSGKTLAAFLAAIDQLIREFIETPPPDETRVLYVSPLKALSNDIRKNLELPLNGIRAALLDAGLPDVPIRAQVRTGDTPQAEREAMKRRPPHILVTTPESLYILLTSTPGREMLRTVRSVIVDEIHALAGNKRGAHLTLSLERLAHLTPAPPVRIGLSATQRPVETMARYLTGTRTTDCTIIDTGHVRQRDLQLEVTASPLEAVMANEVWGEIYQRLERLIGEHRTTLIFVNTRRLAERAAAALAERLGEDAVTAHHGSLAKEHRLDAEQRLKQGRLKALVATASLELGIDIGEVDLVCQLGSPHAIATLLQRVGRSGHRLSAIPKGRLFPLSRDDLVECTALLAAIARDELDHITIPDHPLDVLAQQIVAEVASAEWQEEDLFQAFTRSWPYRELSRDAFIDVVKMLSDGFHTRRGRRAAYLHRDAVHGMLRARRGARLTAITNGGAIPDQFDYDVILQPEGIFIGTLNEDFAFESLPGDIFQLGNFSYRMLKIEQGRVFVEDAHGQPPNIPFWFGEAPGRSDELSRAVSDLRATLDARTRRGPGGRVSLFNGRTAFAACRGGTTGAVPGRGEGSADCPAQPAADRLRAILRCDRRSAPGDPLALWVAHQPRLGSGVTEALLSSLQLRAAGGRRRRQCRAVVRTDTQLRTAGTGALPQCRERQGRPDTGAAGRAHVRDALALGHEHRAGRAAPPRRQESPGPISTQRCRRSGRAHLSGAARLPRQYRRRPGSARSPSGQAGRA